MKRDNFETDAARPASWRWFFRMARQRQVFHTALAGTMRDALTSDRVEAPANPRPRCSRAIIEEPVR